jgi:sugar phosphate permease
MQPSAESPPTRIRHRVLTFLALAAVFAYLCRNCLVVAESHLRTELGLTEQQMGFILGPAFFWAYALAQIPTAWLGERLGSRRCLPAFSVASSLATAAMGWAGGVGLLTCSRIASGVAQAGLFPCAVRSMSFWVPQRDRAMASGILAASMSIGGALGAGLTGWLLGLLPATLIFVAFAAPGIVWAIAFGAWFRERPAEHPAVNAAELALISQTASGSGPVRQPLPSRMLWGAMLTSPAAWLICGQQFFRGGGYAFFASWFATYLMESRGVTTAQSGLLTALPLLATVVGAMLGGGISDAIFRATASIGWSRKGVSVISLTGCAALVFAAFFVADATIAVLVISAGALLAAIAGPAAYTVTMDMGGGNVASLFSTMNMVGNFGAGLTPWFVPQFKTWVDQSPELLAVCDGNSWNAVLLLFSAMYLGSAVCWLLLSTRGTVFEQSPLLRKSKYDSAT